MNGLRNIMYKGFIWIMLMVSGVSFTYAQDSKKDRENERAVKVANLVNNKNFVFLAETMSPMGGRTMFLNYPYDLKVAPEKLQSDLPYFGRAYIAPIDPTRGALQFTSDDYNYSSRPAKRGGWEIDIRPNDTREVRQMNLSIAENGNAFLSVVSNNRQPITFNGRIEEIKSKKDR